MRRNTVFSGLGTAFSNDFKSRLKPKQPQPAEPNRSQIEFADRDVDYPNGFVLVDLAFQAAQIYRARRIAANKLFELLRRGIVS